MFRDMLADLRRPVTRAAGYFLSYLGKVRTPDGRVYDIRRGMNGGDYTTLFRGRWEKAETEVLLQYFTPDDTIIEIGSNIGIVGRIAFETKLKAGGNMYCVEANPGAVSILKKNMARGKAACPDKNVEIINVAIGAPKDSGTKLRFNVRDDMTSGLTDVSRSASNENVIEVPVVSLSSFVADKAPNGYSLICDAEGAEITIVNEDPNAFKNCRQIAMELHHPWLTGRPETPIDMVLKIQALGFPVVKQIEDTYYFGRSTT